MYCFSSLQLSTSDFMCVFMCVHACTGVGGGGGLRLTLVYFPVTVLLIFWDRISHCLELSSLARITVQQARGIPCLPLPLPGITGVSHHAQLFTCVIGIRIQGLVPRGQSLYSWFFPSFCFFTKKIALYCATYILSHREFLKDLLCA